MKELLDSLRKLGKEPVKIGTRWAIRCPAPDHEDRTPSCFIYPNEPRFHCFGCGRSWTTETVFKMLKGEYKKENKPDPDISLYYQIYKYAKENSLFIDLWLSTPKTISFEAIEFAKVRVIDDEAKKEIEKKDPILLNLLPKSDLPMLLFPYIYKDKIYGFKVRFADGAKRTIGKSKHFPFFGMDVADLIVDNEYLFIAEGETDTMSLWTAGFKAIGLPSASIIPDEYWFSKIKTNNIVIVRDNDVAGEKVSKRLTDIFFRKGIVVNILEPEEKDINETLIKSGAEKLRKKIKELINEKRETN